MAQLVVAAAGAAIGGAIGGPAGARIGWMIGSMVGQAMFAEKSEGPKIGDGNFTSNIYGQAIPVSYGTIAHAGQLAWWSGLITRTEDVGGKGGGGAEVEKARMNLLLAVCEGPQAAVLRIWANGRLIATYNGIGYDLDDEVLPAGEVRVYLGTEDQVADPTYEAAVGAANAVPYRGTVMVAIDGLEGEQFANRPPTFKIEVTGNVERDLCPLDPFAITPVQQEGLFLGSAGTWSQNSNGAAYDPETQRYYVATDGPSFATRQIESYSVSGVAPVFEGALSLTGWNGYTNLSIGGFGFDPENSLVRLAGGYSIPLGASAGSIEYVFDGATLQGSAAFFVNTFELQWGNYPTNGEGGGTGARYGAMYSIYPADGGEAGWWIHGTAIIQYRLARLVNDDEGVRGWHTEGYGRTNRIADIVYIPQSSGLAAAGINFAWRWDVWQGYADTEGSIVTIDGADGSDATQRRTFLSYAPGREKLYIVADDSIASIDLNPEGGFVAELDTALTQIPHFATNRQPTFAVWNERGNNLVLGDVYLGTTTILAIDPDTMAVVAGPCSYESEKTIHAPKDLGDGRFVCILGDSEVAIITVPGGSASGGPITLREIVEGVCDRSGLPAENLDATAGTDLVGGYKLASQTNGRQAIEALVPGYFFDLVESGTQLVLRKRGAAAVATIDSGELGAHVFQLTKSDPEPDYELEHIEDEEVPRMLELTWIDPAANYDPGTQKAERQTGTAKAIAQIQVPVVFDGGNEEAARAAHVNLWHAHASKNPISLKLTHAYERLEAADAIMVPLSAGVTQRVRIDKLTRARPLLEIEGVFEEDSVYTQGMGGVPRYQGPRQSTIGIIGDTLLELMDLPPLREADNRFVLYTGMARQTSGDAWPGASLYKSIDDGSSYSAVLSTTAEATMGALVTALPAWTSGNVFDRTNTLTVRLTRGTLSSATELGVLNGMNAAVVGSEIIQFVNATLVGDGIYELDTLLRHRRGTEWAALSDHSAGTRFVLLSESSIRVVEYPMADLNVSRRWKGVTSGQAVADATVELMAAIGNSIKPLAPVHIAGTRDVSDNLTITWVRRARLNAEWQDGQDVPLDEPSERYRVYVFADSTRAVIKRYVDVTAETWEYTAANQVTDFGSAQATVHISVYQITPTYNALGHAGEAAV